MAEFVPPPPELREQMELEECPRAETPAERLADRIRGWFRYEEPEDDRDRGFYTSAAGEAAQALLKGSVLALLLPAVCCLVILGLAQGAGWLDESESLREALRMLKVPRPTDHGIIAIALVIALISGISCCVLPLVELERKGPLLNWFACMFIISGTLTRTDERTVFLLIIGQFGIHWLIHSGLRLQERRADWEWRAGREEVRAGRMDRPGLLEKYAGLSNFDAEGRSGKES